jgi:hypothetical protein
MNQRGNAFIELGEILARVDDEIATREDLTRLNDLLSGDPEACEFYLDYMQFTAILEEEFGAVQPIGLQDEQRPETTLSRTTHMILQKYPRVATTMWNNRWWAGAAAAAMLTVSVAGFMVMAKNRNSESPAAPGFGNPDQGLAVLRRTLDTHFSLPSSNPVDGDILQKGDITLDQGVAQIELYNGARILLEGPAQLSLISEDEVMLTRGRVRALVPPQAGHLLIHTAQMNIDAHSSEFGVMTTKSGRTQVHNFEGHVTAADLPNTSDQAIMPGLGMEVSNTGKLGPLTADTNKFLTWVDIVESSRVNARRNYRDWTTRIGELSTDPRLMLYYTFEDQKPGDHILNDNSLAHSVSQNGAIVGAEWVNGRWSQKGALEFAQASDRVRFKVDQQSDAMTWMAWVKFDRLEARQTALVHSESNDKGSTRWQITANGEMELAINNGKGEYVNYTSSVAIKHSEAAKQWHQFVTVYHAEAQTVIHYVDGEECGRSRVSESMPLQLGSMQLANCNPAQHAKGSEPCNLIGTVDELLLFRQPLGAAEIRQSYEASKP